MASNPRITVLMSVYNGERYFREAIDSILGQTFRDFEFVIYDDCSTDSSADIAASYKDVRIILRRNAENRGLTWNLHNGVERANGEYIARMDADDIALPDRFEKQVAFMETHRDVGILGSQVEFFNESGVRSVTCEPLCDEDVKIRLVTSFTLLHPTIMIRTAMLRENALNYDVSYRCSQDHALYFAALPYLKFANHPDVLLRMRSHATSISKAKRGTQVECSNRARQRLLMALGIADAISVEEKKAYDDVANGCMPSSKEEMMAFDRFEEKIRTSDGAKRLLCVAKLSIAFSDRLWGFVYTHADRPEATRAVRGYWATNISKGRWGKLSLKIKVKYYIKRFLALISRFAWLRASQ